MFSISHSYNLCAHTCKGVNVQPMDIRGFFEKILPVTQWITRLAVTNLLWIGTALPFHFFLIMFLFRTLPVQTPISLIGMALCMPTLLFPSTVAMFGVARQWIIGEETMSLWQRFFQTYRENYRQSIQGGTVWTLFLAFSLYNVSFYQAMDGWQSSISWLIVIAMGIGVLGMLHFFCMVTHFRMAMRPLLLGAVFFSFTQPKRIFLTLIPVATVLHASITWQPLLFFFFSGSVIACITFWNFHHSVSAIRAKQ
jgi:uncharacterized membrane protein YesL